MSSTLKSGTTKAVTHIRCRYPYKHAHTHTHTCKILRRVCYNIQLRRDPATENLSIQFIKECFQNGPLLQISTTANERSTSHSKSISIEHSEVCAWETTLINYSKRSQQKLWILTITQIHGEIVSPPCSVGSKQHLSTRKKTVNKWCFFLTGWTYRLLAERGDYSRSSMFSLMFYLPWLGLLTVRNTNEVKRSNWHIKYT